MTWLRSNLVWIGGLACIIVAAAWFVGGRTGTVTGFAPPIPGQLDRLDPSVVAMVQRTAADVDRNRDDEAKWIELGMVYEANGLFRYAVACYEHATVLRATNVQAWYRLGAAHERVGDLEPAIDAMTRAATLDDSIASVQWQLGSWLIDTGRVDEAEPYLRRAVALDGGDRRAWFDLVRLHLARREAAAAIRLVEDEALTRGPNGAYGYRLLGDAYRQAGALDEAAVALSRAGAGAPTFATVCVEELMPFRTGVVAIRQDAQRLLQQGRRAEARRLLLKLREMDPDDTGALVMLARLDLQERQVDRAVATLETALAIAPGDFECNLSMAIVLQTRNGAGDLDRASIHADRAIGARPLDPQARRAKGQILAMSGRAAEAVTMLKEAYRQNSSDVDLLALAGGIEMQMERWGDAVETLGAVLAKRPKDSRVLLGLARSHVELGENVRALGYLDRIEPGPGVDPRAIEQIRARIGAR